MSIRVETSEEFERLMEALADDLVMANVHFRLMKDLGDAFQEYEEVFNESRAFWAYTYRAHFQAALFRLSRAYDQNSDALHLRSWLELIQSNLHLFEPEALRQRLQDDAFVDSLVASARKPDPDQLQSDIRQSSNNNPLVQKLTLIRNNALAHKSAKLTLRARDVFEEQGLTYGEIQQLLDQGVEILNRYSSLFKALSYSTQPVGHDDYRTVFEAVQERIDRFEAEFQEEIQKLTESRSAT